jgi:Fic-DOC domain mobile mystery protein B
VESGHVNDPLVPIGDGHTEISHADRAELIPTWIATRGDLFAAEQDNIANGLLGVAPATETLLDDLYLRALHRRMFNQVWRWAGRYRLRQTNLGIEPARIPAAVRHLVADVSMWVAHGVFPADELCVRFHHQLVAIHPFLNGNGRHTRIAADLLAASLGEPIFTWGARLRVTTAELRATYQAALRRADADADDIGDLVRFARS